MSIPSFSRRSPSPAADTCARSAWPRDKRSLPVLTLRYIRRALQAPSLVDVRAEEVSWPRRWRRSRIAAPPPPALRLSLSEPPADAIAREAGGTIDDVPPPVPVSVCSLRSATQRARGSARVDWIGSWNLRGRRGGSCHGGVAGLVPSDLHGDDLPPQPVRQFEFTSRRV